MDVDRARLAAVVVAPHVFEQLVAREDLPGMADEEREQLEGLGLDRDDLAIAQQAVAAEIGLDWSKVHDRGRAVERDRLIRPAEEPPDPGGQLAQAERFGDVVVGPQLEADHLVDLGILGGQHHDRDAGLGPDDPADLDPGELGEHEVKEDEIGALGSKPEQRLAAVGGRDHPESVGLERIDERLAEGRLVIDDEDRSGHQWLRIATRVNGSLQPHCRGSRWRGPGARASARCRARRAYRRAAAWRSSR